MGLIDTDTGLQFGTGLVWLTGGIGQDGLVITSSTSAAALFLAEWGPYGMAMDFTDASIAIDDSTGVLDYNSQGTVSSTTGALLGPGSKLTYSAPSAKLTEQADGYLGFQAHNLCLYSSNVSNAAWSRTNLTLPGTTTTAPDGSTAHLLLENVTNAQHRISPTAAVTVAGGSVHISFDVKAEGRDWVWVGYVESTSSTTRRAWFDMSTVAIGTTNAEIDSPAITSLGGGWFRCSITATDPLTTSVAPQIGTATGDAVTNFVGDTLKGMYVTRIHCCRTPSVSTYVATTSAVVYDLPYVYSSGVKTGILVEPAATNLCTYGATVGDANWNNVNTTATPAALAGPTGQTNLALVTALATTGFIRRIHSNALSASTAYTTSGFFVAGTSTRSRLSLHDGVTEPGYVDIAWTAGVPSTHALSGTATSASYVESPAGSGIYRISVTITTSAGATSGRVYFYPDVLVGTNTCYFGLAQQELGTVATSPIITYGAAVTRAVDNLLVDEAAFPSLLTVGTLFIEAQRSVSDVTGYHLRYGTTATNYLMILDNGLNLSCDVREATAGVTAQLNVAGANALNTPYKIAMAATANDAAAVYNGGTVQTDGTVTMPTATTALYIGGQGPAAGVSLNGLVRKVLAVPRRLSNAELQAITT